MVNLKKFYKNKRVLITGATGFKGAWLSLWLLKLGAKVTTVGFNPNKNKNLFYSLNLNKTTNLNLVDVRNKKKIGKIIKKNKIQIIFHLAAQPLIFESYLSPFATYEINTLGTLNILDLSINIPHLKSVVCVTSDKCYKSNFSTKGFKETDQLGGEDPYSGSKACAEIIINTYIKSFLKNNKKLGIASARAGNVIGGGDWSANRLIPDLIQSLFKNKTIIIRNPSFNRPWQHVMEPLYGYLILAEKLYRDPKKYSGPWNFGTKKNTVTSVKDIALIMIKLWGKGKIKIKKNKKFYEQENLQLNIKKAEKQLNWSPKYNIQETLKLTIDWYKNILFGKKNPTTQTASQISDYLKKINLKNLN